MLKLITILSLAFVSLSTSLPVAQRCEDGCRVGIYPTWPLHGCTVTGDLPAFPGHGVCECFFTTCLAASPCNESITITVDARSNYLCDGFGALGHNETFLVSVSGCGDADIINLDVYPTNNCPSGPPYTGLIGSLKVGIYCGFCDGSC